MWLRKSYVIDLWDHAIKLRRHPFASPTKRSDLKFKLFLRYILGLSVNNQFDKFSPTQFILSSLEMPSRRKPVSKQVITQPIRAGRIAKDKTTTIPRTRARATITSSPHISSSHSSTPSRSDSFDRLGNILQEGFEWMGVQIRQANTAIFDQLMERLDGFGNVLASGSRSDPINRTTMSAPVSASAPIGGTIPSTGTSIVPYVAPFPSNVLSRWPWVEQTTVESIGNGEFNINHLPKLHREEDTRNRHIKMSIEDIFNSFDTTKPSEVLVGQTKMHQAFKESVTFFSAWQVYISIRSSYHPERAPGLALFSERIYFHIQLNYPWYRILNYIIAFFRAYQNSAPDVWNDVDGVLVANNLAVAQQ